MAFISPEVFIDKSAKGKLDKLLKALFDSGALPETVHRLGMNIDIKKEARNELQKAKEADCLIALRLIQHEATSW